MKPKAALLLIPVFLLTACGSNVPKPIKLNVDACEFCKMPISDGKYGAEIQTQKGRYYMFDDISCLVKYCEENEATKVSGYFVHDYSKNNQLIDATTAFYISGGDINSPMNGNIAAFSTQADALNFGDKLKAKAIKWNEILK